MLDGEGCWLAGEEKIDVDREFNFAVGDMPFQTN